MSPKPTPKAMPLWVTWGIVVVMTAVIALSYWYLYVGQNAVR